MQCFRLLPIWARAPYSIGLLVLLLAGQAISPDWQRILQAQDSGLGDAPQTTEVPPQNSPELEFESALLEHVRGFYHQLRSLGVRNLGVLKFVVQVEGQEQVPASLGRLNMRLAEKTELALVWSVPPQDHEMVGILVQATEVAASIQSANHFDLKNRQSLDALFSADYRLAWKIQEHQLTAAPDALLSGVAVLSRDLRHLELALHAVVRPEFSEDFQAYQKLAPETTVNSPVTIDDLIDGGESFMIRSTGKREASSEIALEQVELSRQDPAQFHPLADPACPVELVVLYNGQPAPIRILQGTDTSLPPGAYIEEPRTNQKVSFVVRRRDPSNQTRYGVLLRVNGLNTLLKESGPDERCRLWVFEPHLKQFGVDGYYITLGHKGQREEFRVLDSQASLTAENLYRHQAGLISLTLYAEEKDDRRLAREDAQEYQAPEIHSIKKSILPKQPAESRSSLAQQLTNQLFTQQSKGMIVADSSPTPSPTQLTTFQPAKQPLLSATLRYYRPRTGR